MNFTPIEEKIIELRNKGLTNAKIAVEVGRKVHTVNVICSQLISAGLMEKRVGGNANPTSESLIELRMLEAQVIALRELDIPIPEIATRLGKDFQYIEGMVERLRRERRIKKVSSRHDPVGAEEWRRREELVLPLAKEGKKLKEIEEATGIKAATVSRVILRLAYKGDIPRKVLDRRPKKTKRKLREVKHEQEKEEEGR